MYKLSRSEKSTIFELRTRMIHLKNNFRNIYKHIFLCLKYKKRTRYRRTFIWEVQKTKEIILKIQYIG